MNHYCQSLKVYLFGCGFSLLFFSSICLFDNFASAADFQEVIFTKTNPNANLTCKGSHGKRKNVSPPNLQISEYEVPNFEINRPIARIEDTSNIQIPWTRAENRGTFRFAIWGDSHFASRVFVDQLVDGLGKRAQDVSVQFVPPTGNRPGVKLFLKSMCRSKSWDYRPAYLGGDAAEFPAPGLVDLHSKKKWADVGWDLRDENGKSKYKHLSVLVRSISKKSRVVVFVDGYRVGVVTLRKTDDLSGIYLSGDGAMATLRLELLSGEIAVQGLKLPGRSSNGVELDLFAWPGATVKGWANMDVDYFKRWFKDAKQYDLVILGYGTNEGNDLPFNELKYSKSLTDSLRKFRAVFPDVPCVLIGPGDRGLKFKKSEIKRVDESDVRKFTVIHASINRIQLEIARTFSCHQWSMMGPMIDTGGAYGWYRLESPLMARDLLHFSKSGYIELAKKFMRDVKWPVLR